MYAGPQWRPAFQIHYMRRQFYIFIFAIAGLALQAQDVTPTDSVATIVDTINGTPGTTVTVEQPSGLEQRLSGEGRTVSDGEGTDGEPRQSTEGKSPGQRKTSGYRVQVFSSANAQKARNNAYAQKRRIERAFPAYRCYVIYNAPYWRVKVGDFRNRGEADAAARTIRGRFPDISSDIRVVRDRVNAR